MSEEFYEMLWDCSRCGSAKLLGKTHRFCPGCGSPQDPEARYFPKPGEEVAVADHQFVGKDKMCPYCQAPAAASAQNCGVCGGRLDGSKEASTRSDQTSDTSGQFADDSARQAKQDHREQRHGGEAPANDPRAPQPPPPNAGGGDGGGGGAGKWIIIGIAAVVLLGIGVFVLNAFTSKDVQLQIVAHNWERSIAIEELKEVREREWCDRVPRNATVLSRTREVRDHKQVQDGETCRTVRKDMGDGTFKKQQKCEPKYRKEPVYAERCSYKVRKWKVASTKRAKGQGITPAPSWPTLPQLNTGNCLGCERQGKKTETYTVKLKTVDNKDEVSCNLPQAKWQALANQAKVTAKAGGVFGDIDCDALQIGTSKTAGS